MFQKIKANFCKEVGGRGALLPLQMPSLAMERLHVCVILVLNIFLNVLVIKAKLLSFSLVIELQLR